MPLEHSSSAAALDDNILTASWRLMIDAGMFANFPGLLYLKEFAKRQEMGDDS
jgi:hypothetical protein